MPLGMIMEFFFVKRTVQGREDKHLSVVAGKLSVLEGIGNSPELSSAVSFSRFYCYGKYVLCAMERK